MRLYHHTNNPHAVLLGADPEHDDVELVLTKSSTHSKDFDVLLRVEVPESEMDRLTPIDKKSWSTTNADLRLAGAEVDPATDDDRERVAVYTLAVERDAKLETIAKLRRYVEQSVDRPEASRYTMMLPAHQDHLADLEAAIVEGSRRYGVHHLDTVAVGSG
jgi:hypothetical protein